MKNARVLLVEDDPISGAGVCAWLEHKGAHATYVESPATADLELAQHEFDVLLSDVHMPGNENLAWVERVARRYPALHVVLLTATPHLDSAIRAANLHVAAFLVKPPDFSELESVLTSLQIAANRRRRAQACIAELRHALAATDGIDLAALALRLRELHDLWPLIETDPQARPFAPATDLREQLLDAIQVIERTKDSFRSRELGQLRLRLLRALAE